MLGYAMVVKGGKKNKIIRHCLKVWGQLIIYNPKTGFSSFEHFGLFLHVLSTKKALSFHYLTLIFLLSLTSTESEANPLIFYNIKVRSLALSIFVCFSNSLSFKDI